MEDDVILEIKWTKKDVRDAYIQKYGHEPTDDKIEKAVNNIEIKAMEEASIETGW